MKTDRYTVSSDTGDIVIDLPKNMELFSLGNSILRRYKKDVYGMSSWQKLEFRSTAEHNSQIWLDCGFPVISSPLSLKLLEPDAAPSDKQNYTIVFDTSNGDQDLSYDVTFPIPSYMKVFTQRNASGAVYLWEEKVGVFRRFRIEGGPEVWQQMSWKTSESQVRWKDCAKPETALTVEKPDDFSFENGLYFLKTTSDGMVYYRRINGQWEGLEERGGEAVFNSLHQAETDGLMRSMGVKKVERTQKTR